MRRRPRTDYYLEPAQLKKVPWFRRRLLKWFKGNKRSFPWRKESRTPYEVLVAEIMLQRTIASNVARVYPAFIKKYPDFESLGRATTAELEAILKPLGLWRLKVRVFKMLAEEIARRGGKVPTSRDELEKLDSIGQYTASVVLNTVYGHAEPFIDVNMARVLERFFGPRKYFDIRDDPYLHTLSRRVVRGEESLLVNWAVLDFSALVCKLKRPLCEECPLQAKCLYFNSLTEQPPAETG